MAGQSIDSADWHQKIRNVHTPRAEMNRLVMNYLEKEGFKEAAERFQIEAKIEPSTDLSTLDKRIQIRECVQNGRMEEAIALVNELHPELLDSDNFLFFHIQQQQLIELIRENQIEKALDFAQNHLAERAEEDEAVLKELERTLALLAFEDPHNSPFADLLLPAQRQKIASELNAKILEMENQDPTPQIAKILKLLVWSQKELDSKKVKYVKMVEFGDVKFDDEERKGWTPKDS